MASIGIGIGIEDLILQVLVLVLNFGNCQVLVLVLVLTLGSSEVLVLVLVSEKWYCLSLTYTQVKVVDGLFTLHIGVIGFRKLMIDEVPRI